MQSVSQVERATRAPKEETMAAETIDEAAKTGDGKESAAGAAPAVIQSKKPTKPRRAPAPHRIREISSSSSSRARSSTTTSSSNGEGEASGAPAVERKRPSVRFDESTLIQKSDKRKNDPRKIYIGKTSKAKMCLHLSIPVVVLAVLLFLSSEFDPTKSKGKPKKKQTAEESLRELMQQKAREAMDRRRKDPCALFLHTGSIPGTGWSFFAGQHYQKGDLLMESMSSSLLLLNRSDAGASSIQVPPYALLLKHHPALANAGGPLYTTTPPSTQNGASELPSSTNFQLRATRSIAAGEEIFVSYDAVLHSRHGDSFIDSILFDHIPLESDYRLADGIILDMLTTGHGNSKKKTTHYSSAGFRLLKRSVAKFNRRVAALLPENAQIAQDYSNASSSLPSYWAALRNRTLTSLQDDAAAVCVSNVVQQQKQQQQQDGNNSGGGAVWTIQRDVQKGDIVSTVPIHVQAVSSSSSSSSDSCAENENSDSSSQQECSAPSSSTRHQNCFGHATLPVRFCPLTNVVPLKSKDGDDDNANVEYRWKDSKMHKMSLRELFGASNKAAWNLVALKNLSAGQEVSTTKKINAQVLRVSI